MIKSNVLEEYTVTWKKYATNRKIAGYKICGQVDSDVHMCMYGRGGPDGRKQKVCVCVCVSDQGGALERGEHLECACVDNLRNYTKYVNKIYSRCWACS